MDPGAYIKEASTPGYGVIWVFGHERNGTGRGGVRQVMEKFPRMIFRVLIAA
jgi:hypothetical protein